MYMYWDKHAASDQVLHYLPFIQQFFDHQQVVKWTCSNFKTSIGWSYGVPIFRVNLISSYILAKQCINLNNYH